MAQSSLLQMLEDLSTRVRLLEREKKQAAATIQALEREVGELGAIIAQASAKVDEMLKGSTAADKSQPGAANAPVESKGLEERMGPSTSQPKDLNRRFPRVYDPTEYSAR
jgi:hypothetical protein